jgi:4-diphosphocytidyl-2-C-methyl-D-erythritol kinase
MPGLRLGAFRLVKRLPAAAGIGGGSSDAAAALRLLARLNGLSVGVPAIRDAARHAGADVPVCLEPRTRMMRGAGEELGPPLRLPRLFAVLANPRVAVETPKVFRALAMAPGENLAGEAHPAVPDGIGHADLVELLRGARNDLEAAARAIEPAVGDAVEALRAAPGCRLARMSGSGATAFGLFDSREEAEAAARALRRISPHWWIRPTSLG